MGTSRRNDEIDPGGADGLRLDLLKKALGPAGDADRLAPARREAVLQAALERPATAGPAWGLAPLLDLRKALAAVAVLAIAAVAVVVFQQQAPVTLAPAAVPVANLEVRASEDGIVLQWASEGGAYRVIRATDPEALDSAPAELVEGNRWVDPEANGAQIVFYRVEEAL